MKGRRILAILVLVLGLMVWAADVAEAEPVGTAFTYQGWLMDKNNPAEGEYDFEFRVFDDPNAGAQQGSTIDVNDLYVEDGHFTVELDFGDGIFTGDARWLETTVAQADGSDPCTLSPRQELTPTPYAIYASNAEDTNTLDGYDATAFASSIHNHDGVYAPVAHNHDDRYYTETELQTSGSANVHWDNLLATMPAGFADGVDNVGGGVPSGVIVMWSGSIATTPAGWALCDGTNGTPDLRDRFIVGARQDDGGKAKSNIEGSLKQSGGDTSHDHGGATGSKGGTLLFGGGTLTGRTASHTHSISSDEHIPPYYALAFIMRLP